MFDIIIQSLLLTMKLITKAEIDPKSWLIEHIELEKDIKFKMIHSLGSKPQLDGVAVLFRVEV